MWLVPWYSTADVSPDSAIARELRSELSESHVLYGIEVRPVACRQDCDDVLFEFMDGSDRFAVVHLTFSGRPESDPHWPRTTVFENQSQFEEKMRADNEEF